MAKLIITARLTVDKFPELSQKAHEQIRQVLRKAAFDVEAHAKKVVPVDTGNLRNSIQSSFPDEFVAVVGTHVEYAPYVEFGTYKMAARPYLMPAVEKVRPGFTAAMKRILG
jgi:HK97 gp10 family phage protein